MAVRTSVYLAYNNPCGVVRGEWYLALQPATDRDLVLRLQGVKIFDDGGACNNMATTFPFVDPGTGLSTTGDLYFDRSTLTPIVANADAAGWQVLIHSLGDRSNPVAMNAIADVLAGQPNRMRHRIDHNLIMHPDHIAFYGQAGIVPIVFPNVGVCAVDRGTSPLNALPIEDRSWALPNRTMLAAGLPIAWHGDWCCGAPLERYDPVRALFNFVTRRGVDADGSICEPPDWVAAEAITAQQALRAMTSSSAYALGMERFVGSLEPRKLADLVVLSDDPLQIDSDQLKDLTVLSTVVGGAPLYCAAGFEELCEQ
jgi:predicted amidohydrolase YtcJ